ncbi:hypothetical protein NX84_01995 [Corynebacterium minutissimum]|nr:hypothetical protein NX84_01995 [Corynebacterium minutissimum]
MRCIHGDKGELMAACEGRPISDFACAAFLERVEDYYDLQELRAAMAEDSGERFNLDEVLKDIYDA